MAYRKLHVNGKEYGFVIGSDVVKVKGPPGEGSKIAKFEDVLKVPSATIQEVYRDRCECCHGHNIPSEFGITPSKIAAWVMENFK